MADATDDLSKLNELLQKHGPVNLLGAMSALTGDLASRAGDESAAKTLRTSSQRMEHLARALAQGDESAEDASPLAEDEEDAGEDDEPEPSAHPTEQEGLGTVEARAAEQAGAARGASPSPPESSFAAETPEDASRIAKERIRMKVVAGFQVKDTVKRCRLRRVSEAGDRGDLVGRANERGMEENEWRVELMTPERLRDWFGPGRYMFEWFGDDGKGANVALGRSRPFRIFDDEKNGAATTRAPTAIVPPPAAAPPASFDQTFAMLRYFDEKLEREKIREREDQRFREELASKERIARVEAQAKISETQARLAREQARVAREEDTDDDEDDDSILDKVSELLDQRLGAPAPADPNDMPPWAKALGLKEILDLVKPQIPELIAKFAASTAPKTPTETPNPYPVRPFRPKTGTEG